jgi:hypothetical protein
VKNKLTDLNDALFAQLERLGDESMSSEKLAGEIDRSRAITEVAEKIIENASLQLEAFNAMKGGHGRRGLNGLVEDMPRVMGLVAATSNGNGGGHSE